MSHKHKISVRPKHPTVSRIMQTPLPSDSVPTNIDIESLLFQQQFKLT